MTVVAASIDRSVPIGAELQEEGSRLLVREEPALRRLMHRYLRNAGAVDDVYQEVSLKVLRRLDTLRDASTIRGWLFQVARNACLDWLRIQVRRRDTPREDFSWHGAGGDLGRNPCDRFLSTERVAAVRRALAELPESQREVLRLRLEQDLDHEAISERLGISRQAVEVRLCRGRAAIKQRLTEILEGDL
jgi:RNA polymerase sigma-70 factor (ECF subfamily)